MNTHSKNTKKALFRGDYGTVYEMASHAAMPVGTLLQLVSKTIHKSIKKVRFDLQVLVNPSHRSNGGKSCNVAKRQGWVRLAPYKAA